MLFCPEALLPTFGKKVNNHVSHVQLFATPWTVESMGFSRPEYWSG